VITKCVDCARAARSCCVSMQVYVTIGDVRRITDFLGQDGFVTFERLAPEYEDATGDPAWSSLILNADGYRRVLLRASNNACCFLRREGCGLPMGVRPLLCRLHPYDFTQEGLAGISAECPLSSLRDWQAVLEQMGLSPAIARNWHQALYAEIMEERNNPPNQASEVTSGPPLSAVSSAPQGWRSLSKKKIFASVTF
jgi:uncharacterized protein